MEIIAGFYFEFDFFPLQYGSNSESGRKIHGKCERLGD